ncbi:hypothetical protein DFH06DRAFT_1196427 [Mycena polygramma]|nr:hypothetical protein DFH06DRAFT_1196427 [Mycena polygramma]
MGAFPPDEYSHSTFAPDFSSSADDGWSSRGWSSSSSRPVSAAPSSIYIPDEDAWSSRGWSSSSSRQFSAAPSSAPGDINENSPPSVSVEISQWDDANWGAEDSLAEMGPVSQPGVDVEGEAADMDSRLGWDWRPSGLQWLDAGVSSEVVDFPDGIKLTGRQKVYALHRVKGCPSQFPFHERRTAFLVDFTGMDEVPAETSVDQIIRDQDSHSWGSTTGARGRIDAHLPGCFFGLSSDVKVACRRASPTCNGIFACQSLDSAFLKDERRELDPEPGRRLAAATLRTREMQDDTDIGRTLAFHRSLQRWRCHGIRSDGQSCDGSISLRKLNTPDRNKNHILLCSKRQEPLTSGSFHSQARILDHISEELFVKVMNGQRIVEEADSEGACSRVVSARTGAKGAAICPFNHLKDGRPYIAKVEPVTCSAGMHIFCPSETRHPELARMAVVVPSSKSGHSHPPPPPNKCTLAVAARYRECVRKIGFGATVKNVENAQSTKDLLDGKTPSLFHPGLMSRDTKTRLIREVKKELNNLPSTSDAKNTRQQVATYLADQENMSDDKRFLQSSLSRDGKRIIFGAHGKLLRFIHELRTLDCDTTFKPVAGKMQIFEINGWLVAINESVTVMRVWMEVHDRQAYKTTWEEIQRLVLKLTGKPLKFKGLHKAGKILGVNADLEAAPLLGFSDALAPTIDREDVRAVVGTDSQLVLPFGVIELTLSDSDRKRIFDFKYAKTPEEVESFKAWIPTVPDPQGELKRWWDHKLMHRWLLPGLIQCLSNIPLEQWNTMEPTTNLGEAQHAWNNAQTGISMGVIESFKKYEELDIRRAAEIEIRMATAISRNSQSEVSQRYANRTARQSRKADKVRAARAIDANVATLQQELSETKEELKAARSDAKAEPSAEATGRVRELEAAIADVEGKLKLAKAEAKATAQAPSGFELALGSVAAPSELPAPSTPVAEGNSGIPSSPAQRSQLLTVIHVPQGNSDVPGARRTSARKRGQSDSSDVAPVSSRKRRKKLVDPLAGWDIEDPDTGEQLTGHEWVERYPEEFKQHYKKDHQRYLEFLAQSADS